MKTARARISRIVFALAVCLCLLAMPALGQDAASVFKSRCAACHGADGKGDTGIGRSLHLRSLASPEVQKQSDKQLTDIIADGKGAMPEYKSKLSATQIKGQVGFIRDLAKK